MTKIYDTRTIQIRTQTRETTSQVTERITITVKIRTKTVGIAIYSSQLSSLTPPRIPGCSWKNRRNSRGAWRDRPGRERERGQASLKLDKGWGIVIIRSRSVLTILTMIFSAPNQRFFIRFLMLIKSIGWKQVSPNLHSRCTVSNRRCVKPIFSLTLFNSQVSLIKHTRVCSIILNFKKNLILISISTTKSFNLQMAKLKLFTCPIIKYSLLPQGTSYMFGMCLGKIKNYGAFQPPSLTSNKILEKSEEKFY